MEYRFWSGFLIMKTMIYIFFIILFIVNNACQDPSSLDANREISVVYDPNDLPAEFLINPQEIDFGIVHPNKSISKEFRINNITNHIITIEKMQAKNFYQNYSFSSFVPFSIEKKGNTNDNLNVIVSFKSDLSGNFDDKIDWGNYKNPITNLKVKVASVWADDINFETTKVGNFDLKFLKINNSSNFVATIDEFNIVDNDNVILIEPAVELPLTIPPNSSSQDIIITFYPKSAKTFNPYINIKASYSSGDNYTDETISLYGRGIY